MLPPPRRPFLLSKARRRRGPGLATARRQWEARYRDRFVGVGWGRLVVSILGSPSGAAQTARFS